MTLLEMGIVGFVASFLGSSVGIIVTLYLFKKQIEQMQKLKKSLQATIRNIKKSDKK